jgi:hypothetical protein
MNWPQALDFHEALQEPGVSFQDPELRLGQADTDSQGFPRPRSGNFADVDHLGCPSGRTLAVKCFTRPVPGLQQRYDAISTHLGDRPLQFMVEFQYLEQGIRIRGDWYPVVKMRWVEGFTLNPHPPPRPPSPDALRKPGAFRERPPPKWPARKTVRALLGVAAVVVIGSLLAGWLLILMRNISTFIKPRKR